MNDIRDLLVYVADTDDADPPADLVARGLAMGRTRRRRNTAGLAIAALAIAGLTAVGLPHVLPGTEASHVADDSRRWTPEPQLRSPIEPEDGISTLTALLPDGDVRSPETQESEPGSLAIAAIFNGGRVEVLALPFRTAEDKTEADALGVPTEDGTEACDPTDHTECRELPDGSWFDYAMGGTDSDGGSAWTRATVWTTDGLVVQVTAYDSKDVEKQLPVGGRGWEPVLSVPQLEAIARSDAWFQRGTAE